jgi:1-acyl-sn-glycerol-3-phosphate acyltransferase
MRPGQAAVIHPTKPQDIAMLQYTSGSTGNPKGVVLTHANLLVNIRSMGRALRVTPADVFVSWLPLYHDMGLIGAWMGSLVYGFKYPVMSPLTFLAHPHLWLRAIHRHGGTLSGGPNFCYELCLRRIQDADVEGLDLSSWRFAFNGAEPVSPDTMEAFIQRFARHHFRREAMAPVYGLAEATLGVAFPPPERGPLVDRVDREQFTSGGRAVPAAEGADALIFVACGVPVPGHQVRVVDPSGRELPERSEGHIQFSGPSVTSGYFRNPEATADLLDGAWMNTGDYGYVAGGDIHISGRIKDTIIRAGRNIHPYELEEAVGNLDGIRKGCVAVFGSRDARSGTEKIVVLAETRETDAAKRDSLRASINELGMTVIGMAPDDVMLAPPNTVLKTSSGKIRRTASREVYEGGGAKGTRAVWLQLVRLAWSAVLPQARRLLRAAADRLYGAYALFLLGTMGALVWIGCALFPDRPADCWKFSRRVARAFLWLTGMPPAVRGVENLPPANAGLLAINHQSYLDGILVVATLEEPRAFVAKRELLDHWVPRIFLTRIGSVFVDRLDAQRGVEDTSRFAEAVRGGLSLIVFPEGTFRRMPGVLPFRMGAFMIAAQAGTPVVPITIRGTRSALRDGQWLFHRSRLSVVFSRPIEPTGADWNAAIRLRDAARAEILRQSGEPDLGEETSLPPKGSQPQKA